MRLHTKPALSYLTDVGHKMSEATFFREKKKIEEMKFERMQHIALYFQDQHLERIDKCELVEKLCWENYRAEKDPTKRVKILESIITMQPYLSGYYEATKTILESRVNKTNDPELELESSVFDVSDVTSNVPKSLMRLPPIEEVEAWTDNNNDAEEKPITTPIVSAGKPSEDSSQGKTREKDGDVDGEGDGWKLLNCPTCQKSFYNNFTLSAHQCKPT